MLCYDDNDDEPPSVSPLSKLLTHHYDSLDELVEDLHAGRGHASRRRTRHLAFATDRITAIDSPQCVSVGGIDLGELDGNEVVPNSQPVPQASRGGMAGRARGGHAAQEG